MSLTQKETKDVALLNFLPSTESNINLTSSLQTIKHQGLGKRFFEKLTQNKDKILQVDAVSNSIETCGMILQKSIVVATEMSARGIEENNVVVLSTRTRPEETVILLATLFIGAILATLDPQADLKNFQTLILTLKPALIFCDVRSYKQIEIIKQEHGELQSDVIIFGDHNYSSSFEKILTQHNANLNFIPVSLMNAQRTVAFIVASQGTGNQSKLICVSHDAMQLQINEFANIILQNPQKILSFFPLHWITQLALVCYCFESSTIRVIPGSFAERCACRLIHDLQIDVAALGTEYARRMLEDVSANDFDFMITNLRKNFKTAKVLQCYGLSEMSGLVAGFPISDYDIADERPGSVGKVLPGIKFKIIDLKTGQVLGSDWWGELIVTGASLMLGYYKNVRATIDAMHKRYFKTGDVAQYDSDGYLYIQGRVSDYITIDGKRLCPLEIEEVLIAHKHILEAVVVGNEKETVACIVKNPEFTLNAEGIMRYLSERLPNDKRPTKIKFLEYLPKTTVGKVKRSFLKQLMLGVTIERTVSFESK
ncbi:hypothetical protein RN001_014966 [Aquatica leii]|uniref:Uncharacterized protein n=1 Tax=Aquatica leii TaxID=1421715 RepID=A0AAN7NYG3_9COLE|nr:hypothetical protein RN001_014966 [Aquatica leii]